MRSPPPTANKDPVVGGVRQARRLETRERLFGAALAEISRSGLAGADVTAIATAAGVVRGTFYFHFPTKEHVLVELERNQEVEIVAELSGARASANDLESVLQSLVRRVLDAERRWGPVVFRDMLGLHFSSTGPVEDELTQHPLLDFIVGVITEAQQAGHLALDADAHELGVFFLTGLFALLATGLHDTSNSDAPLSRYVTTIVKGMEIR